jgi:hypothetical protein
MLCASASFSSATPHHRTANPVTVADIPAKLADVKNVARRAALSTFYTSCRSKQWAACEIAWFDLHGLGLGMVYHTQSGLESWAFSKDEIATNIYNAITNALRSANYAGEWDLIVKAKVIAADIPASAPARLGLDDESWRQISLLTVQRNMQLSGVTLDVFRSFTDERAEWLRYLALVFAARNDATNSYVALGLLQSYAKLSKSDAQIYNTTLTAVQSYFSKSGK